MRNLKFRVYPAKQLRELLEEQLGLCCWLYNRLLAELHRARTEGRSLKQGETQALIVHLKKAEKPELTNVYSKVLQMVNYQLWANLRGLAALKAKGKKVGKLRFKGKGWFKTLHFNQSGFKIDVEGKRLHLSKIGAIPAKYHRSIAGRVKGVIIKRERTGKWVALVQVEEEVSPPASTGASIGLDVGVKHFLTDSAGRKFENPRFYARTLYKIRHHYRNLSRKQNGSKNREKAKLRLAKAHEKLVNQRDDFLHKVSRFYINQYDIIAVEALPIQNMVKNRRLAQKILDASWGKFLQLLAYKAESADKVVVKVNPRGTSQEYHYGALDRDYNAALNILARGLSGLGRPAAPVERVPLRGVTSLEVVTGQVFVRKQEAPCVSGG
jgi:putative transposase